MIKQINKIEALQKKLGVPGVSMYLVESERMMISYGPGTTLDIILRLMSTTLINLAPQFNKTPIKLLSELGETMSEQIEKVEELKKSQR